jgi:uncharacterized membrane protein
MPNLPAGPGARTDADLDPFLSGALAYLVGPLTGVYFFVRAKEDSFIRFHAAQSIVVGSAWIGGLIVLSVLTTVIAIVPVLGPLVGLLLWAAFAFASLALWVALMYQAYRGLEWELPIAADYARELMAAPKPQG